MTCRWIRQSALASISGGVRTQVTSWLGGYAQIGIGLELTRVAVPYGDSTIRDNKALPDGFLGVGGDIRIARGTYVGANLRTLVMGNFDYDPARLQMSNANQWVAARSRATCSRPRRDSPRRASSSSATICSDVLRLLAHDLAAACPGAGPGTTDGAAGRRRSTRENATSATSLGSTQCAPRPVHARGGSAERRRRGARAASSASRSSPSIFCVKPVPTLPAYTQLRRRRSSRRAARRCRCARPRDR